MSGNALQCAVSKQTKPSLPTTHPRPHVLAQPRPSAVSGRRGTTAGRFDRGWLRDAANPCRSRPASVWEQEASGRPPAEAGNSTDTPLFCVLSRPLTCFLCFSSPGKNNLRMRSISIASLLLRPLHPCETPRAMTEGSHPRRIFSAVLKAQTIRAESDLGGGALWGGVPSHVLGSAMQIWKHPSLTLLVVVEMESTHCTGRIRLTGLRARGRTKHILHGEMCHSLAASSVSGVSDGLCTAHPHTPSTQQARCIKSAWPPRQSQTHIHMMDHPPANLQRQRLVGNKKQVVLLPFLFVFAPIPALLPRSHSLGHPHLFRL
ncbi:hypothetical protein B0T14DRAFT_90733 [Immersiella caudata]|uniref:Uncharacterized protein n=1 Tax=Immersiella caudata TaxID=314043 RepID=A0AA40C5M2_9PEZI|nr:hypothetical protein B0T14DRAFT_90733 [Immersiella caudata]